MVELEPLLSSSQVYNQQRLNRRLVGLKECHLEGRSRTFQSVGATEPKYTLYVIDILQVQVKFSESTLYVVNFTVNETINISVNIRLSTYRLRVM